jgi:hypothetical protein
VVYEWGAVVSRLLAQGDIRYKISAMYLEFNNGTPPLTVPSLDRTRTANYYHTLVDNDYVSVPIRSALVEASDETLYPNGNRIVWTAKAGGDVLEGVAHSLEFGSDAGSVVIGAALVSQLDEDDPSQDLVLCSFYFDEDEQQPKLSTSEIGVDWQLTLL